MNAAIDISNVILKTNKFTLRAFTIDDLDDFYEYAKVDGVGQMAGWQPHKNKEESLAILKMFIEEKKVFAIEHHSHVIGSIGIEKYNEKNYPEFTNQRGRELGFVLSKDYWGNGYMAEIANRVMEYLFDEVKLDFITCGYFKHNRRSKRVQEKLGFHYYKDAYFTTLSGESIDSVCNILYKAEYKKNTKVEYWDAYTKDGTKIPNVTLIRGQEMPKDQYYMVVEILVRHIDGTYLLMQRDYRKHLGGMWEASAGGALQKGEEIIEGAFRELREETGIQVDTLTHLGYTYSNRHNAIIHAYLAITDIPKDAIHFQEGETIGYQWVSKDTLLSMELASDRIKKYQEQY